MTRTELPSGGTEEVLASREPEKPSGSAAELRRIRRGLRRRSVRARRRAYVLSRRLVALARTPRQVFTRELLLEQVWGYRHAADTRLVNVHVQRLRAKIERDPEKPEVVLTVRGVGYKAGPP